MSTRAAWLLLGGLAVAACKPSPPAGEREAAAAPPPPVVVAERPAGPRAAHVRVTTLSTMMTDKPRLAKAAPRGEWGYAALVEIDDTKILFDTGRDPEVILHNLDALGMSLAGVDHVVLSHHHGDHSGGLAALRQKFPGALGKAHVARGFVEKAPPGVGGPGAPPFVVVDRPTALLGRTDVKLTGPIRRAVEERTVPAAELAVPDDQALVIDTVDGLVVITGCGHAGIVNTLDAAQAMFPGRPIHAVLGGLHLFERTQSYGVGNTLQDYLDAVAARMNSGHVRHVLGSHCTGLESLLYLRRVVTGDDARRGVVDTPATRFIVGAAYYDQPARRHPFFSDDPAKDRLVEGINPVMLNRPIDWPAPQR